MQRSHQLPLPNSHPETRYQRVHRTQNLTPKQTTRFTYNQKLQEIVDHLTPLPITMPTTTITTFSCSCTATTSSSHHPNPALPSRTPYPPPSRLSFPCRSCARSAARNAESEIRAEFDPKIQEARDVIENAFRYLSRDNPGLRDAIRRKQEEEMGLMVRKERGVIRAWRGYRDVWE